ncbi:MAG: hypothetical protein LC541_04495 [Candidatus Thiodiazotropha sp.]|nr:hypothetical protein [Candidatus Thiodiazotropha sp.]MCM8882576.1 hypothetical protein [Candidatus Thiodiazotropha sp.]MCM8918767.1 hypothetical protein [Candidatus Thiodiazotropha sp.]
MCDPVSFTTAGVAAFGAVQQRNAAHRQANAIKQANKPAPTAPTQASAGVRDAATRARRRASSGGQSSTRLTNPLGIPGDAPTSGNTLLGN